MYNQSRSRAPILFIILAGTIAGIGFLIATNVSDSSQNNDSGTIDQSEIATETSGFLETAIPPSETTSESIANPDTVTEPDEIAAQPVTLAEASNESTIFIPSASIYASIVRVYLDGTSWDVSRLGNNVGHLEGTAWLGDTGNVVLSAHVELADGRRGIFANIEEINIGDFAILEHAGAEIRYVVTNKYTTAPTDLTPIYPSDTDRLTLITCDNYDFFQDSYLDRTIIVAERLS